MNVVRQRFNPVTFLAIATCLFFAGISLVETAESAPMQARGSISSRVQTQAELCEQIGGGKISVSYSYEGGKMVSAQTSCKGGTEGGRVCVNDAKTTDCYKVKEAQTTRPVMQVENLPPITVAGSDGVLVPAPPEEGGLIVGAEEPVSTAPPQSSSTMVDIDGANPVAGGPSGATVIEWPPVSNPNAGMTQLPITTPMPTSVP